MRTWEDQAGFPIIHVEKSGSKFILTQNRFGGGEEIYSIPISYASKSDLNFENKTPKFWMMTKTAEIDFLNDEWIILNIQLTGYYKVSYSKNMYMNFLEILQTDYNSISYLHRGQFFNDFKTMVTESTIETIYGLEVLSYMRQETEFYVWRQFYGLENFFTEHLFTTTALSKFQELIASILKPLLDRLGFEEVKGEPSVDTDLRNFALIFACKSYQQECLEFELQRLKNFVSTGEGSYKLCEGIRLADQTIYSHFISRNLSEVSFLERYQYISGLGCSLNRNLLKTFLELTLDSSNNLQASERVDVLSNTIGKSVEGLEVTMDFIIENFVNIIEV